jgi:hypothetical protein
MPHKGISRAKDFRRTDSAVFTREHWAPTFVGVHRAEKLTGAGRRPQTGRAGRQAMVDSLFGAIVPV